MLIPLAIVIRHLLAFVRCNMVNISYEIKATTALAVRGILSCCICTTETKRRHWNIKTWHFTVRFLLLQQL